MLCRNDLHFHVFVRLLEITLKYNRHVNAWVILRLSITISKTMIQINFELFETSQLNSVQKEAIDSFMASYINPIKFSVNFENDLAKYNASS